MELLDHFCGCCFVIAPNYLAASWEQFIPETLSSTTTHTLLDHDVKYLAKLHLCLKCTAITIVTTVCRIYNCYICGNYKRSAKVYNEPCWAHTLQGQQHMSSEAVNSTAFPTICHQQTPSALEEVRSGLSRRAAAVPGCPRDRAPPPNIFLKSDWDPHTPEMRYLRTWVDPRDSLTSNSGILQSMDPWVLYHTTTSTIKLYSGNGNGLETI